jgi:hypothetical protein
MKALPVERKSSAWGDKELVKFFKNHVISHAENMYGIKLHGYILVKFFKNHVISHAENIYGIKLHGYIYHAVPGNTFHDEICLMDRSQLYFDSVEISPKTTYGSLPTSEEWKTQNEHGKVVNSKMSPHDSTLVCAPGRDLGRSPCHHEDEAEDGLSDCESVCACPDCDGDGSPLDDTDIEGESSR